MVQVLRHINIPKAERDPNVLVGSETMDDAGVYRLTADLAIVQTVDLFPPVVDDAFIYGQIAAANALSDIYAMGAVPKTVLNVVGFPDDELPLEVLSRILSGGSERIVAAGASLIGGHSVRDVEIKYGLAVTGIIHPDKILTNTKARPGDVLYLTKALGTGFITTAHKADKCPTAVLDAACRSMIELNDKGARAMADLGVLSATDITGFGFSGHSHEMAEGSGVTLRIEMGALPLLPGTEDLIRARHFTRASETNRKHVAPSIRKEGKIEALLEEYLHDPQTSGGLLMAVPKERAAEAEAVLKRHEVLVAARIGEVVEREEGVSLVLVG
jgi:selenide,water dikinase